MLGSDQGARPDGPISLQSCFAFYVRFESGSRQILLPSDSDTYEFLYCTWKDSVLAVFYYRGLSEPKPSVLQAVISTFRH